MSVRQSSFHEKRERVWETQVERDREGEGMRDSKIRGRGLEMTEIEGQMIVRS